METSEVIVAYQRLSEKIDNLDRKLDLHQGLNPPADVWLDIMEACNFLKVSKRTLQNYRDDGTLPFSQVGGKIYFKQADLENHLKSHYVKALKKKRGSR